MKKQTILIAAIIWLISCSGEFNSKEKSGNQYSGKIISRTDYNILEKISIEVEKNDTVVWIDTLIKGNFLKMYSTSIDDCKDIFANWGNEIRSHKYNFQSDTIFDWISTPFSREFFWVTKKSFCFPRSCGQSCIYGLVFNIEEEKPILIDPQLAFYPNMTFMDFETDNYDLYITSEDLPTSWVIVKSVDTKLTDTIKLNESWLRGTGTIYHNIDEIKISNGEIRIYQKENGEVMRMEKGKIKLE